MGRSVLRGSGAFRTDKPLSGPDAEPRTELIPIVLLHEKIGPTMINVTRDQIKAVTLSDGIVLSSKRTANRLDCPGSAMTCWQPVNRRFCRFSKHEPSREPCRTCTRRIASAIHRHVNRRLRHCRPIPGTAGRCFVDMSELADGRTDNCRVTGRNRRRREHRSSRSMAIHPHSRPIWRAEPVRVSVCLSVPFTCLQSHGPEQT